jgi:acyl-CoA thioesterase
MDRLEEARKIFAQDKYATVASGIEIEEVKEDYARCSMKLTDIHRNAFGGVMGGAIYTLADFTFAVASNFDKDRLTASLVGQATFLAMSRGEVLYGESQLIRDGRQNCFYQIRVYDDLGKDIATVAFTGVHIDGFKR